MQRIILRSIQSSKREAANIIFTARRATQSAVCATANMSYVTPITSSLI